MFSFTLGYKTRTIEQKEDPLFCETSYETRRILSCYETRTIEQEEDPLFCETSYMFSFPLGYKTRPILSFTLCCEICPVFEFTIFGETSPYSLSLFVVKQARARVQKGSKKTFLNTSPAFYTLVTRPALAVASALDQGSIP